MSTVLETDDLTNCKNISTSEETDIQKDRALISSKSPPI